MFSNMNKPTFGATSSAGFGFGQTQTTNANPFGQPQQSTLFGKPAAGGFGSPSTSTFGQPQAAGGGLFSGVQQQQPGGLFQNANTSFGAAPATQTGFGGGGGLFGQQPSTSAGIFNSPTSSFGQQAKPAGFGFGQTQNQPLMFGQQPQAAATSNLFGGAAQSSNLFGNTATAGFGNQQSGTPVKFNPVTGTDTMVKNGQTQSINTKHHSITCMKEYEAKSFEELRWEDYQVNRKGPQQGSTGFGAATPFGGAPASSAPTMFGQPTDQNKSAFGQTSSVFGQSTTTFGQQAAGGFGMTAQPNQMAGGGMFGAKPAGFGAAASTATTTGFGFGAQTQAANPFGAAQPNKPFAAGASVFGATTSQPTAGFGTTGGMFGAQQQQTATTGMFGKPAQPTAAFGQLGSTGFGMSQPTASAPTNTLFTANKPLFGQTTTTQGAGGFGVGTNTFGQTNTSSFGASLNKPAFGAGLNTGLGFGNTFGTQQQTTGLFGNAGKPEGGGLFGNAQSGGLFGNAASSGGFQGFGGGSFGQAPTQTDTFSTGAQFSGGNLASLTSDPFGDAPHLAGLEPKARVAPAQHPSVATNPTELKSLLDSSKKVDMTQGTRLKVFPKIRKDSLFDGLQHSEAETPDYLKTSCRRLVVKARAPENPNLLRDEILNVLCSPESAGAARSRAPGGDATPASLGKEDGASRLVGAKALESGGGKKVAPLKLTFETTMQEDSIGGLQGGTLGGKPNLSANRSSSLIHQDLASDPADDYDQLNPDSKDRAGSGDSPQPPHPTGIVCTRPEYYTLPALDELTRYVDADGACVVKGFTIGRRGFGNVYFPEEIDVAGLNVDQLVHFRYREINVYPDETKKPPIGQGLNRRAQVTLDRVYPKKSGTNHLIKDCAELVQMNFAEKLRKVTVKKNAKFKDYRPETGSWVFLVEHFSKYGFTDSDDETDSNEKNAKDSTVKGKEQKQKEGNKIPIEDDKFPKEGTKYGIDDDIVIDDDNSNEDDLLQQSMLVDMHENYHEIPTEVPDLHMPYDSYKASKNIQLMKSTLFAEDDRSSDASSHVSIIRQYLDIPEEVPQHLPPIREEPVARRRAVVRPNVYKVYNFGGSDTVPKIESNSSYMDMAVFKGKSFKIGWSKGFNFCQLKSRGEVSGEIEFCALKFKDDGHFDPLNECLADSLKIVLEESTYELTDNIPTFRIKKGKNYLLKQAELFDRLRTKFNRSESRYLASVWQLCLALWGPGENTWHHRRYLLSEWLKSNLNDKNIASINMFRDIFDLLAGFKIYEAANLCVENRMPNLSLIVSQLSLTGRTKCLLQGQIEAWYDSLTASYISDDVKRIYLLLSGIPSKDNVNVFEDLEWKTAFALHLWYVVPNGAHIDSAIEMYKNAFEEIGYAEKPTPPYSKSYDDNAYDVLYHILLLFKSNIHRLSSVLNPATHTDNPLDYKLSWLLLQLFLSLEVGIVDAPEKIKFCASFANQLESMGKWEWAVFSLLHINDNSTKRKLVVDILERNLSADVDKATLEAQNNLVNNMKIPAEWIHRVKGEKNNALGRYYEAFNHFTKALDYGRANDILLEHILPGLFINEQYAIIKMMIEEISPGCDVILHYQHGAGLMADFLNLQDKVITFKQEELFRLQSQLNSISERLRFFPVKTEQQKLCVAEMSKRCSWIYKELCKKSKNSILTSSFSHFIDNLVMPPDFKQNEALYLINEFDNFRLVKY
ncbi:unnamed protein product [Brassicogethes aeneus]|uniref:Nuclear pore complex protein Nup98-Nup96 n=1 Tax=Brassicogethes aeneus TaxID=1431903 RepID=A0A9P0AVQ6_BRAAE|nr:unnamed protein product [Brassicogethes aeneus]